MTSSHPTQAPPAPSQERGKGVRSKSKQFVFSVIPWDDFVERFLVIYVVLFTWEMSISF